MVKEYFESQQRFAAATKNKDDNYSNGTSNKNSAHKENKNVTKNNNNRRINSDEDNYYRHEQERYYRHEQERKNTLANPYYPNTDRHRRILDIPFSMIILDGIDVGLELVNSNNPRVLFRSLDKGSSLQLQ